MQSHHNAIAGKPVRSQGCRRSRDHRSLPRDRQRCRRRVASAWCEARRYAYDAAENLEPDPYRRPSMIAHEFEYSSTTQLSEALALMANGAKPLAGGMS